jgi:hypothetical protein
MIEERGEMAEDKGHPLVPRLSSVDGPPSVIVGGDLPMVNKHLRLL